MNLKNAHVESDFDRNEEYDERGFNCLNDEQLWQVFKNGSRAALAYLYQLYFFKLYNYGIKICQDEDLVKDSIQELFVYLWKKKENLSENNAIKLYLYKSLRRSIYTQLRKNQRSLFKKEITEQYRFEFILSSEQALIAQEISAQQKEELLQALNQLPQRQKEVVFLRYFENLSPQEVSIAMSLTLNSTYVLLSRAISFLKKHVDKIYWLCLTSTLIEI